jgi:hypothetical protein
MPEWPTIWAAVQGLAVCATAAVAWYQLNALREEQEQRRSDEKAWRTLEACERYEGDLIINQALKALRDARDGGWKEKSARSLRFEAILVLNYFEGIAIAADQGFYVEHIVRDHLEHMMRDHVDEFLESDMVRWMELNAGDFVKLKSLLERWADRPIRRVK